MQRERASIPNANAKGKGIDSEGWVGNQVFRLVKEKKREKRVRSQEEISENLSGNLKP